MDLRLPQYWNINDKSRHLQIGSSGYELTYHAHIPGKLTEAASIRTNFPMRPQCGVYYYEITIVSMGNDGLFAVGLCNASHALDKLPGASLGSFGYHGQNGQTYKQNAQGTAYGPTYAHGDVIGCGVNYFDGTVFFTKNGISLGVAFDSIDLSSQVLYPCIGLSTQGEKMTANFGHAEFAFDIAQYIKVMCHESVEPSPQDRYKVDIKSQVDAMVLSYLTHQGYIGTVNAMKKNMDYIGNTQPTPPASNDSHLDQDTRNSIRKSIMTGHVDLAVQKTEAMYPNLLQNNADLLFQLKARKFLDLLMDNHRGEPLSSAQQQSLCSSYQHTKYWSQLMDLFTLLSFADPKSSPMSHSLDTSRRDLVASDLNDAIQAYQHQANKSNLEWILKQAIATSKELALSGHGMASLIHMQSQFTFK
ncbi:hypothetical protein MUCCIDRAFT_178831 [Mucor lusitanicus CBS 277.49]|uniref:B30.2/SPRY domain-containing protein n=1 Tax=Mucor lusitanicus CBS 277.49 TaxID=747725 RepID=A0A168LIL4_MUCCL|nr:hypothetical protein MUCCIDRAFT_178831 [Mucor lusitanicus CBS 277.49]